ncbi:MAG: Asp23/Gls24 family envelope stress response protein [Anaerolineae bacterium]|nr:Asp23/Gls24 family envelope stress response protein [Anaerolineae bacterium]
MSRTTNQLGNIYISHRAIGTIAHQSALESYGVVGLAAKNIFAGISNVLTKDPTLGVEVHYDGQAISIDLYIIIEYGTRITSVASSVASNVRFQVEKALGINVKEVNVHVRGLRISNTD